MSPDLEDWANYLIISILMVGGAVTAPTCERFLRVDLT